MDNIVSIEALVAKLLSLENTGNADCLAKVDIKQAELEKYASWIPQGYTRNCILRTASFELLLICWDIGAQTKIHNHGGQKCWVLQAWGNLTENKYDVDGNELVFRSSELLHPNQVTFMNDDLGYHQLQNLSNQRSYTIHVYAMPIDNCNVYNTQSGHFETATLKYDTAHKILSSN